MAGEGRCMQGCKLSNLKKIMAGGGGVSGQPENPPRYATDSRNIGSGNIGTGEHNYIGTVEHRYRGTY